MRSFGSDNNSGVHPRIWEAIADANRNHAIGYGEDKWTEQAANALRELMGMRNIDPLFVFNGTGANIIALQSCTQPFHSIICASTAHIAVDECGAPSKFTGCPLKEIDTPDGKLTPELVMTQLHGFGIEHHSQPKVIAISQTTEMGTAYSPQEIRQLADLAHEHDMYLFMDGTRIANACAYHDVSLREMTIDTGVDIFTIGGTKNGLMFGEVIVPLRPELGENMKYYRKQASQLYSKMRFMTAQFIPYFKDEIWLENARQSNLAAQKLANGLERLGVHLTQIVESNAVFFILNDEVSEKLREKYFFYDWNSRLNERRLVCSWDTSDDDIVQFIDFLQFLIS